MFILILEASRLADASSCKKMMYYYSAEACILYSIWFSCIFERKLVVSRFLRIDRSYKTTVMHIVQGFLWMKQEAQFFVV